MPSQHIDKIADGIFIGDVYSVINTIKKDTHNANVIISVLTEDEYEEYLISNKTLLPEMEWYRFVIDDDASENIQQHFYTVHRIIKKALNEGKQIIVHCAAGMSRSPTLVMAYMMIENRLTANEALEYIQTMRPTALPNTGFMQQLYSLEYTLKKSITYKNL